jgi:DNA repair protein RadA/Sms
MVRPVAQAAARLKEAAKLGFARAFVPETARSEAGDAGMALTTVGPLMEIVSEIAPKGAGIPVGPDASGD